MISGRNWQPHYEYKIGGLDRWYAKVLRRDIENMDMIISKGNLTVGRERRLLSN